jgi:hypothetical protein
MGNKEVRKLAAPGFTRQAPSLRLTADPKGLGKTEALSFTVSVYADGGLQRQGGRKRPERRVRREHAEAQPRDWKSGTLYSAVISVSGHAASASKPGPQQGASGQACVRRARNAGKSLTALAPLRRSAPESFAG